MGMKKLSVEKYEKDVVKAIKAFWKTRDAQQKGIKKSDQGNRGSVTGGKQLDGFIEIMVKVSRDLGIPQDCIYTRDNVLPGFFRPSKDWDFLIVSPSKQLIAVVEFKSQVGSFGNNFNNRTEEALGSAVDLWTAFKERTFSQKLVPWLGYVIIVEEAPKSSSKVRNNEPLFRVRSEFRNTSYLDRYKLFCQKIVLERHYTASALIVTSASMKYNCPSDEISFESFLLSFMGFVQGKLKNFSA